MPRARPRHSAAANPPHAAHSPSRIPSPWFLYPFPLRADSPPHRSSAPPACDRRPSAGVTLSPILESGCPGVNDSHRATLTSCPESTRWDHCQSEIPPAGGRIRSLKPVLHEPRRYAGTAPVAPPSRFELRARMRRPRCGQQDTTRARNATHGPSVHGPRAIPRFRDR
jgi:hypothetical protein